MRRKENPMPTTRRCLNAPCYACLMLYLLECQTCNKLPMVQEPHYPCTHLVQHACGFGETFTLLSPWLPVPNRLVFQVYLTPLRPRALTPHQPLPVTPLMPLQVIEEAQKWCHRVSGGTELPALLSLADAAMTQFISSVQVSACNP